jgi:uncharacterized protein (DUF1330 family)/uncharacterized membrane protein YphA (DoxX/SURF4 family)
MSIEMLVGLNVIDDDEYQLYRGEITPFLKGFGGGFRYDFKASEVFKSKTEAPINRVFTIYFPDDDAMNSFFSNDEYLDIKKRRFEKSVSDTTILATYSPQTSLNKSDQDTFFPLRSYAVQTLEDAANDNTRTRSLAVVAQWFLRVSLAVAFFSAVTDRFGFWGPPGAPNVAWGDWSSFLNYVAVLNGFAPKVIIPALAWAATIAEVVLAVGLVVGWRMRLVALMSGFLLLLFAVAMTFELGIKAPLDYSVFGVAAGAFLLAAISPKNTTEFVSPP